MKVFYVEYWNDKTQCYETDGDGYLSRVVAEEIAELNNKENKYSSYFVQELTIGEEYVRN